MKLILAVFIMVLPLYHCFNSFGYKRITKITDSYTIKDKFVVNYTNYNIKQYELYTPDSSFVFKSIIKRSKNPSHRIYKFSNRLYEIKNTKPTLKWIIEGWYSRHILLSSDGKYLIRLGGWKSDWGELISNEEPDKLEFYENGKIINTYFVKRYNVYKFNFNEKSENNKLKAEIDILKNERQAELNNINTSDDKTSVKNKERHGLKGYIKQWYIKNEDTLILVLEKDKAYYFNIKNGELIDRPN